MRSKKFRNKPKPDWMIDRQTQILMRFAWIMIYILILCCLYAIHIADKIEQEILYAKELTVENANLTDSGGLYAGALQVFANAEKEPICTTERSERGIEKSSIVEIQEEEVPKWSNDDFERLAHLIYAEGGAQGETCMIYIGSVVLNRVNSDRYPNTIKGVINQKGQYTVKGWYMSREPSETAYHIANYLLEEGSQLPSWVLYQHGNNRPVAGTKIYKRENGEVFSYEERDRK